MRLNRVLPRTLTVKIDRNEQQPFVFPAQFLWHPYPFGTPHTFSVKTEKFNGSPTGADYVLAGFEDRCAIERKKDLDELATNLLSADVTRAFSSFDRLTQNTQFAYLAIEETPNSLMDFRREIKLPDGKKRPEPGAVYCAFWRMLRRFNLHPLFLGKTIDRVKLGSSLLHVMLAHTPYVDDLITT